MAQAYRGTPVSGSTAGAEPSAWAAGWTGFAGIMMTIQGVWWVTAGLIALFNDQFLVQTEEYIFRFDATTWGWIHLVLGIVIVMAGFGVFTGALWARLVGVTMATVAMLIAFAWLPWYPVWAVLFIIASISIIWALTVHGREFADYYE